MDLAEREPVEKRSAYTVVTVAYRSRPLLITMLQRIPPPTPIIVVDNSAAEEDITAVVQARPMTTYLDAGGNVGFGAACNLAANLVSQPLIAFVNPDADVDATILDRLVEEIISDPRRSSAGPMLLNVNANGGWGSGSGGWLPTPLRAVVHATGLFRWLPQRGIWIAPMTEGVIDVEWIAGTCLMIRADVFRELGGFGSQYFLYQEDMDLGGRLREQGYRQALLGSLHVQHAAGTSTTSPDVRRLAWFRSSALVDYLTTTYAWPAARIMCATLALGALLRAVHEIVRGRAGRIGEFATSAVTLAFPARTLKQVRAQRRLRTASGHPTRQKLETSLNGRI
jgi:N-acetylglucosaminyl-diphospho-decaprenol L-rhamnosyltransferase